jgi:hypothetical protein
MKEVSMRNVMIAGAAGLMFVFGALSASALDNGSSEASRMQSADRPLIEGRAVYESNAIFGQLGNDFGPDFHYGAPASERDFAGVELHR